MNILDSSVAKWISELHSGDLMCPNPGNRDMKGLCPRFSQGFVFKVTKPLAYVWNTEWTFINNSLEKLKQIRKFLHISTVSNSAGKHLGSCFKDYISCHVKQSAIQHKFAYKCPQFFCFESTTELKGQRMLLRQLRQFLRGLETMCFLSKYYMLEYFF